MYIKAPEKLCRHRTDILPRFRVELPTRALSRGVPADAGQGERLLSIVAQ